VTGRRGLKPDLFHCNPISSGYYLNLDGEVWPCPKMAAGIGSEVGAKPLATYDASGIYPDEEAVQRWRGRDVTAIAECDTCVGRFVCSGGCALEAARKHGGDPCHPSHQPIEEYMETVIRTQQRRLTRAFGPRTLQTR
jgi:radical SAM protein with 4Fe4S-binding SPASM domain